MNAHAPGQGSTGSYASADPQEMEQEIEHTRAELDRTLDELQSRLSPRERLRAAANSARQWGQRVYSQGSHAVMPDITRMIRLDHTHALALFRRFRSGTSPGRKQALIANACLALEIHAQLEEEIFYPALREAIGHNEMLDKSAPEHGEMRVIIADLRAMEVGMPGFDETAHKLMRAVLHHVADEESCLLPLAEAHMPDRLGELGLQMTRRRIQLLRPHLGEVAVTTARSFPVLTAASAVAVIALGWLLVRASLPASHRYRDRYRYRS